MKEARGPETIGQFVTNPNILNFFFTAYWETAIIKLWKGSWRPSLIKLKTHKLKVILKLIPLYFSCLRKCCNAVFAVKLQECFVGYKISPDFPSAWGWLDNESNFVFWVNCSFNVVKRGPQRGERGPSTSVSIFPGGTIYPRLDRRSRGMKEKPKQQRTQRDLGNLEWSAGTRICYEKTTTRPYYTEQGKSLQGSSPVLQLSRSRGNIRSCLA